MKEKKGMTPRARMTLIVVSYIVGSLLIFALSFTLSCYFMINTTGGGNATEASENTRVVETDEKTEGDGDKARTSENTGVDNNESYEKPGNFPTLKDVPTDVAEKKETAEEGEKSDSETSEKGSDKKDDSKDDGKKDSEKSDGKKENDNKNDEDFEPETVVTPSGGVKEEPEEDITVIEIP